MLDTGSARVVCHVAAWRSETVTAVPAFGLRHTIGNDIAIGHCHTYGHIDYRRRRGGVGHTFRKEWAGGRETSMKCSGMKTTRCPSEALVCVFILMV